MQLLLGRRIFRSPQMHKKHPYSSLGLLFIMLSSLTACVGITYPTAHPTTAPINELVFASGHIEATDQFNVSPILNAAVTEVLIHEGDQVVKGQKLFLQDNANQLVQEQEALVNLNIAKENAKKNSAQLQQLHFNLSTAQDKLKNDSDIYQRYARLWQSKSISKMDLDNAFLNYTRSKNDLLSIQQNITQTELNLDQSLNQSRSGYETAVNNSRYLDITAPGNYEVFQILKHKGDFVTVGTPMAVLGTRSKLVCVLQVDENSIDKIRVGQPAYIELNTKKNTLYKGSVKKIYPLFDETTQSYRVDVVFDTFPSNLINGTLVQVNVLTKHKDQAMLIPRIYYGLDGRVFVQHKHHVIDTINNTKAGIISTDWVEIIDPRIHETDTLINLF